MNVKHVIGVVIHFGTNKKHIESFFYLHYIMSSQVDDVFIPFTIPSMITIEDLPSEVLIYILSFISLKDLLQYINRVCKRFYLTINTTPKLWSDVYLANSVHITKASLETVQILKNNKFPIIVLFDDDIDETEIDWYLSSCSLHLYSGSI